MQDATQEHKATLAFKLYRMKVSLNVDARSGAGSARVTPENLDDMYCIFSILSVGDRVKASTVRKVLHESTAGGAATSERVRTQLTVRVLDVLFDPELGEVRVHGVNCVEHELVKAGAHHALELELNRPLEIFKDAWASVELDTLRTLADAEVSAGQAEVYAVMLDVGTAQVCALLPSMTLVRARVDVIIPKKRGGSERHEAARTRFFGAVFEATLRTINWASARVILFASPGFVKDDFMSFLIETATSRGLKAVLEARPRFVCAHAAGGHKRALAATLADPAVASRLSDVRAFGEGNLLSRFNEMLTKDAERAQYGWRHVRASVDAGAVEVLLVNDAALRVRNPIARSAVLRLLEDARAAGVAVSVISSLHVSGEMLHGLGDFAAILRYAVYGLEEIAHAISPLGEGQLESVIDGNNNNSQQLSAGHRIQALSTAPVVPDASGYAGRSDAAVLARGGFDTESDMSDDSDA